MCSGLCNVHATRRFTFETYGLFGSEVQRHNYTTYPLGVNSSKQAITVSNNIKHLNEARKKSRVHSDTTIVDCCLYTLYTRYPLIARHYTA